MNWLGVSIGLAPRQSRTISSDGAPDGIIEGVMTRTNSKWEIRVSKRIYGNSFIGDSLNIPNGAKICGSLQIGCMVRCEYRLRQPSFTIIVLGGQDAQP